jgi:hypothetical protein
MPTEDVGSVRLAMTRGFSGNNQLM